jgi:outer membrane protein assembly factor BamB
VAFRMTIRVLAVIVLAFMSRSSSADDWPQWRGPNRDGVSKETGLLKEWPKGGPKLLWTAKMIGRGYSTPAVAAGRIYLIGSRDGQEFCQAFDAKSGERIWNVKIGKVGPNKRVNYPGSRATPTVDGELLYALGSDGDLVCLETAKGIERWRRSYQKDFDGVLPIWAFSESPLVDGERLICTPGGKDATIVALKKKTGAVEWKSPLNDTAEYASPTVVTVGSKKQYVQFLHSGVVGVDADTGKFSWRYDKTKNDAANIMTPVFREGLLFSSTPMTGAGLIQLIDEKDTVSVKPIYFDKHIMAVSMGGAVLIGNHLYGTAGQRGELACVDFKTGKERWTDKCVGMASICSAEGLLYVRGHMDGTVVLVEAASEEYKEKGRFEQPERSKIQAWPHPVVANGCLLLRDQTVLLCYDVKAPKNGR